LSEKIFPVHNAIESIKSYKSKKSSSEKLILFVGRITHQKGPRYFLQTAKKVIQKDDKVRFVLAGHGDQFDALRNNSEFEEISSHIKFTGHIDRKEVFDLLSKTDVFCMTSVSEPFGLAALEAAQFGVPVILTSKSGVTEVLPGALIADYWNTDLMADHILKFLGDKKLAGGSVQKNKKVLKLLTWDHATDQILKAYTQLY